MDVSSIASLATSMAAAKNADAVNVKMLRKSLDIQAQTASQLLAAIPQLPANPNIGRNVNTTA